jgi:cytochrome d ubiquinol oxidase subunit II
VVRGVPLGADNYFFLPLRIGLIWWSFGMCMAFMDFVIVYWQFRGKVPTDAEGYGH